MPEEMITADEVARKTFTAVRLREGYSIDEVNSFMKAVEFTIRSLSDANDALVIQLSEQQGGIEEDEDLGATAREHHLPRIDDFAPVAPPTVAISGGTVGSVHEASVAATRMLEIAARNHDDLIAAAKLEAESIRQEAQREKEELLGRLDVEHRELKESITSLRDIEDDSRQKLLKLYSESLEAVSKAPHVTPAPEAGGLSLDLPGLDEPKDENFSLPATSTLQTVAAPDLPVKATPELPSFTGPTPTFSPEPPEEPESAFHMDDEDEPDIGKLRVSGTNGAPRRRIRARAESPKPQPEPPMFGDTPSFTQDD